jgi:hypothetical protein
MAELIIKQWRLATLRVQLDLSDGDAAVSVEALGYLEDFQDEATSLWSERYPLSAFGLKAKSPKKLKVPDGLGKAIRDAFSEAEISTLWLRLVPPYGYLGAAPWESSVPFPMLRVPDRLPVPAKLGKVWRTVLVVSAQPGSTWAAPYIDNFTNFLDKSIDGPVEVDVFADAGTAEALQPDSMPSSVRVHDPTDAKAAVHARAASSKQRVSFLPATSAGELWPAWIASGLHGQAVRAVHVVLDGAFDESRPMLAMHPDPEKPMSRSGSAFVTGDELLALTDALGADVLSFGSPPDNPSDAATRMIADSVGQRRAGATVYSALTLDHDGMQLAKAHAAIRDNDAWPHNPSLFAYLQPQFILARPIEERNVKGFRELEVQSFDQNQPSINLEQLYSNSESVPSWVAASDRYLGSQIADLAQQADSQMPTAHIKGAYNKGAADALATLRDIVDRNAEPT